MLEAQVLLVDDGEAIDGDAARVGERPRHRHHHDVLARRRLAAVAGDIDHLARRGEAIPVELADCCGDAHADPRSTLGNARQIRHEVGEAIGFARTGEQ